MGVRVRREGLHLAPPLVDATGASTRRSRHARVDAAAGAMGLWGEEPARGAIRAREAQQISPCQKLMLVLRSVCRLQTRRETRSSCRTG